MNKHLVKNKELKYHDLIEKENGAYRGQTKVDPGTQEVVLEGFGQQYWDDESFYIGTWKQGQFNGFGMLVKFEKTSHMVMPTCYMGEFQNGVFHGKGMYFDENCTLYCGSFINGIREGFGILTYLNNQYYGLFKEGQLQDLGIQELDHAVTYVGHFDQG